MMTARLRAWPLGPQQKEMPAEGRHGVSGGGETAVEAKVELQSLSKLTGFPVGFIKEELALCGEDVSMEELRKSMLSFLDRTMQHLKGE